MVTLNNLISRNIKLYFKDKGTFFTSLLSPLVLLVLFVSFLGNVYRSSFLGIIPEGLSVADNVVDSFTISWLLSSLLGVSCVTVAFCSNIIMAQDKINGNVNDLLVAPIKKSTLALSYFIANFITTLIVCYTVTIVGFIYLKTIGWFLTTSDVLLIFSDVFISVLFGSSFAALVDNFVKTQGGIGAVSTLISALYGFICGAYMPISEFSPTIRKLISCLPGTYTIGLLRHHYMNGVLLEANKTLPDELITALRDGFDANIYFFDHEVELWQMYTVVGCAILVMLGLYIIINKIKIKSK